MIRRLAETLAMPLRERNALLLAAGFAPTYREADLDLATPELAPVRAALDAVLRQQEPFPAVVMNRQWDVLEANGAAARFFGFLLGSATADGRPNILRAMLSPDGLRPFVVNWDAAASALIGRVHREAVGGLVDEATQRILDEVLGFPGVAERWRTVGVDERLPPVVPMTFAKHDRTFSYFSMVTTLGTPQDVLLQEIRIECFFPVDGATRMHAEQLARTG
jgi:hypothetical protein